MTIEDFYKRFDFNSDASGSVIGRGGFSVVYKAYDKVRKRFVAVKRSEVGQFAKFDLKREVEVANEIEPHPNILRYENVFRISELLSTYDYAVMKYYPEGNLENVLRRYQLTEKEQKHILTGILNGLAHIHQIPIIHRDFKTANILMDKSPDGEWLPLICDFGQSRLVDNDDSVVSNNSQIALTPKYSAPEQLLDTRELRTNADLWAFGVITYQMIQGKLPFKVDEGSLSEWGRSEKIKFLILQGDLPKDVDTIREPYREIIKKCLVTDPEKRVKSAGDLLKLLGKEPVSFDAAVNDLTKIIPKSPKVAQAPTKPVVIKEQPVEEGTVLKTSFKKEKENDNAKLKWLIYLFAGAAILGGVYFFIRVSSEPAPAPVVENINKENTGTISDTLAKKNDADVITKEPAKIEPPKNESKPEINKPTAPGLAPVASQSSNKGTLVISSNEDCDISVDGKSYGKLTGFKGKSLILDGTDGPNRSKVYIVVLTNSQGEKIQEVLTVYAGKTYSKQVNF